MDSQESDPLSWVALDSWDVDPADLRAPGHRWSEVFPTDVDDSIDDSIRPLPTQGWREVTPQPQDLSIPSGRLFAAPQGEGWAVVYVSPPPAEGRPILSAGPPVQLRPGRPTRRQGLRLTWPTRVEIRAGELEDLQITLVNVGEVAWVADLEDTQYVHAWLLDGRGDRIGPSRITVGGSRHSVDGLAPGQAHQLPVSFDRDVQATAPGVYGVEAAMPALDLWSTRSRIVVLA